MVKINKFKNYSMSDLYGVHREIADLIYFSLLYSSNDACDEKNHSLLQMYCIANDLSLIIERLVIKEVDSMSKSNIENAFRIYTLKDKNNANSRKTCSKIFDEKLSDEQIAKINKEFEILEKNVSEWEES